MTTPERQNIAWAGARTHIDAQGVKTVVYLCDNLIPLRVDPADVPFDTSSPSPVCQVHTPTKRQAVAFGVEAAGEGVASSSESEDDDDDKENAPPPAKKKRVATALLVKKKVKKAKKEKKTEDDDVEMDDARADAYDL
ncbi:hypothetical protein M409DRAFT_24337 [Zasmidium cellare ATCC 36951]|uniref:Uncharacterized protein n=1 Tax=Zasmidium cellare ATCC 36951 TaxID=1080233 RepID=A0A6A6CJ93_ZASCE|nr:uncharacterized protein M409DRAFT_24337 [Zasmidium cellare ATCC 36951]KAF2165486.1 hypothetical protein M409DRAFT_24337 [Zasmidium cellare ATCC 36951]